MKYHNAYGQWGCGWSLGYEVLKGLVSQKTACNLTLQVKENPKCQCKKHGLYSALNREPSKILTRWQPNQNRGLLFAFPQLVLGRRTHSLT